MDKNKNLQENEKFMKKLKKLKKIEKRRESFLNN